MDIKKIDSKFLEEPSKRAVRTLFESAGWQSRQIEGQMEALEKFLSEKNSAVFLAFEKEEIVGYLGAQFYSWNRLGQIHGLIVHGSYRQQGIGSMLIREIEKFMKMHHARGVYVDTPADNLAASLFYRKNGYLQDYVMTEYYDEGLDGIAFLKIFKK